jgi:hypothetical protein
MLIAIAGKARVGKDTIGRYIAQQYGFEHYYFAKPLKDMVGALGFPASEHQTTEEKERIIPGIGRSVRYLWQTLGTEWGRQMVHPDLWLLLAARRWEQVQRRADVDPIGAQGLVITDCRFENEAQWARAAGGVVVHVQGKGELAGMSAEARSHASEAGVSFVTGDRLIFNDYDEPTEETLKALYGSVAAMMNGLLADRGRFYGRR